MMRTIIATGPKKSGCTLLTRLFDSHPEVCTIMDESYFWEHVYNIDPKLFLDVFKSFSPKEITDALEDRSMIACLDGWYRQYGPSMSIIDINFSTSAWLDGLKELSNAKTIADIWKTLSMSYAAARQEIDKTHIFIASGDFGKSISAVHRELADYRGIFYIRNPYYALDSLKKARELHISFDKRLNAANFMQELNSYYAIDSSWDERTTIVRFEDLVASPKDTMKRIAEHVGIQFSSSLLDPTIDGEKHYGSSSFRLLHNIDKYPIERPIKALTRTEIELITEYLGSTLDLFGYERITA